MSSSRHPDKWIVPGGGMEPEEEPSVAAAREVCEEVGFLFASFLHSITDFPQRLRCIQFQNVSVKYAFVFLVCTQKYCNKNRFSI